MFLQTTGQCTSAFMEASESLHHFVVPRLVLVFAGIAAAPVACLFKVCGRLSSSSAQEHVVGTQLGLDRGVLEKL